MKILVIIPVINLWNQYTKQCVESIHSDKNTVHTMIIDNASTDETSVQCDKNPLVYVYHRNEERKSVSGSWNQGMKFAFENGYDFCLILNNDTILNKGCIDAMVDRFEVGKFNQDKVILISGLHDKVLNKPRDIIDYVDMASGVAESDRADYACFMVGKEYFETIGLFDENFAPAYFEDWDSAYRTKLAGYRYINCPRALFYHYGSRTQNEALGKQIVPSPAFEKNKKYYLDKWGGSQGKEIYKSPFNK